MNNVEQLLSNVIKKTEVVARKLGLVSDVYKENRKVEYSLVDKEIIGEIKTTIGEMKKAINELSASVKGIKIETITQINEYLDNLIIDAQNNDLDINSIKVILQGTLESIEEDTTQINIERPTSKGRGGEIGTVSIKKQGKIDEAKNIGGVIVSKKDSDLIENIGGDYTKVTDVLEKIKIAIGQIANLAKSKNVQTKDGIKDEVSKIINDNMNALVKNCEECSKDLPNIATIKKVKKQKSFTGLYKVAIVGLSLALLFSGLGKKHDFRVSISSDIDTYQVQTLSDIELQQETILDSIENAYISKESAGSEAVTINNKEVLEDFGINSYGDEPEVVARNEKLSNIEELQNYKKTIESVINEYRNIKNPTNGQWLDYQIQLNSVYEQMMQFNIQIEEKTNEYLELWNSLNEEHIGKNVMSQNAVQAHNIEISINDDAIERNTEQISDIENSIESTVQKIEFYEQLQQLQNIEEVKNIEDVSETLNRFLQTDIAKEIGTDKLFEFMETTDLNLFSAYTKLNNNETKEFLSVYKLMENTYQEYVKEYCDGDNKQVEEEYYTQYFEKALGFTDKIGEAGTIDTFKAMLQQNNINNNFYREYGYKDISEEKEIGSWSDIKRSIKTLINGQRRGEYNDTVEEISQMQREMSQHETDIDINR